MNNFTPDPSEAELLLRLQRGDREAFADLVRDHHRALTALATPLVGVSEAEEVVQNAWVKAYQAVAKFEGRSKLRTWLSRIVLNEAKMQLRSRRRETLFADNIGDENEDVLAEHFNKSGSWSRPMAQWHADSPDALLMGETLQGCIERLLAGLPAQQKALLELRDVGGVPFDEICNELSVSASNARVLLHRARTQLYKLVNHYQETGEC